MENQTNGTINENMKYIDGQKMQIGDIIFFNDESYRTWDEIKKEVADIGGTVEKVFSVWKVIKHTFLNPSIHGKGEHTFLKSLFTVHVEENGNTRIEMSRGNFDKYSYSRYLYGLTPEEMPHEIVMPIEICDLDEDNNTILNGTFLSNGMIDAENFLPFFRDLANAEKQQESTSL